MCHRGGMRKISRYRLAFDFARLATRRRIDEYRDITPGKIGREFGCQNRFGQDLDVARVGSPGQATGHDQSECIVAAKRIAESDDHCFGCHGRYVAVMKGEL